MTQAKWPDGRIFAGKASAYVRSHLRIIEEFTRSLAQTRHYVELAERAKDAEPAETIVLLEQIQEIDLLGHLQSQQEGFTEMSRLLQEELDRKGGECLEADREDLVQRVRVEERYAQMLAEAEVQQETIAELMLYLRKMA